MAMKKELVTNILMRILATFAASGLGVIGAGAIAGVQIWKAVFMAGVAGVAEASGATGAAAVSGAFEKKPCRIRCLNALKYGLARRGNHHGRS
jgi:hypothetical protein